MKVCEFENPLGWYLSKGLGETHNGLYRNLGCRECIGVRYEVVRGSLILLLCRGVSVTCCIQVEMKVCKLPVS